MVVWHILFAVSGQTADFSTDGNATLSFAPRISCDANGEGYGLPFLLPGLHGTIACHVEAGRRVHILNLTVGMLKLDHLVVNGEVCPNPPTKGIQSGEQLSWTSQ